MKLCKDCKHSVWPDPIAALYGQQTYTIPMCGHPDARRSLVDGALLDSCADAREDADYVRLAEPGCGREGARFEAKPPAQEAIPACVGGMRKVTREELEKEFPRIAPSKGWGAWFFGLFGG